MSTRRKNAQRAEEETLNEVVPLQDPENPQVPIEEGVLSNVEIRSSIHSLTQVLATQDVRDGRVQVNPNRVTLGMDWFHACFPILIVGQGYSNFNFRINQCLSGRGKTQILG